jgi:hypothetical protein
MLTTKHCRVACFAAREKLFRGMMRVFQHCDGGSTLACLALSGLGIRNTTRQASSACMFMLLRRFGASSATVRRSFMPYDEGKIEMTATGTV